MNAKSGGSKTAAERVLEALRALDRAFEGPGEAEEGIDGRRDQQRDQPDDELFPDPDDARYSHVVAPTRVGIRCHTGRQATNRRCSLIGTESAGRAESLQPRLAGERAGARVNRHSLPPAHS